MSRTWIDKNLSDREAKQLADWLIERSSDPTGELIKTGLQELFTQFDDYPSIASCLNWKKNKFSWYKHLRDIADDAQAAELLVNIDGRDLDEANRVMLQGMNFKMLRAMREGRMEDINPDIFETLCKNVPILARQGMARQELDAKLEKLVAERKQLEAAANDDKLSDAEKAQRIRGIFGL